MRQNLTVTESSDSVATRTETPLTASTQHVVTRKSGLATTSGHRSLKETGYEQIASFVEFFVWLLVLKAFFIPLFFIPTGSMAETLMGANGIHSCPNCGTEYPVNFVRAPDRPPQDPESIECPNCRWRQRYSDIRGLLRDTSGDRVMLHGWNYDVGGMFGPRAWDVVVFRNPNEPDVNYIKRLIGLPGQKIEVIDGNVFVNDQVAVKPRRVQEALWFPYYNHDCLPVAPSQSGYFPHWRAATPDNGWSDVRTRRPCFDGLNRDRSAIRFLTNSGDEAVCEINDIYGYNWPEHRDPMRIQGRAPNVVGDIRLSCEVLLSEGEGFVELMVSKHADRFSVRLHRDGRLTLERLLPSGDRETWGQSSVSKPAAPHKLALGVVDYAVIVDVDGVETIRSSAEQYSVSPGRAKELRRQPRPIVIEIAGDHVRATVSGIRIDRDIYYTGRTDSEQDARYPWHAGEDNPLQLGPDEYFVMGDNSPESFDSRYWHTQPLHLGEHYKLGTVPADQMLGRAFFVYMPGFLPLWSGNVMAGDNWTSAPCWLPNVGALRWIH